MPTSLTMLACRSSLRLREVREEDHSEGTVKGAQAELSYVGLGEGS